MIRVTTGVRSRLGSSRVARDFLLVFILLVAAYYFGLFNAALGNDVQALQWLNWALDQRDEAILYVKVDPEWDHLRSDPQYKAIVRKVGLP